MLENGTRPKQSWSPLPFFYTAVTPIDYVDDRVAVRAGAPRTTGRAVQVHCTEPESADLGYSCAIMLESGTRPKQSWSPPSFIYTAIAPID
jgi:hypothetical protein